MGGRLIGGSEQNPNLRYSVRVCKETCESALVQSCVRVVCRYKSYVEFSCFPINTSMTMTVSLYSGVHMSIHRPHKKIASNLLKKRGIYIQKRLFSVVSTNFGQSSYWVNSFILDNCFEQDSGKKSAIVLDLQKLANFVSSTVPDNYSVRVGFVDKMTAE